MGLEFLWGGDLGVKEGEFGELVGGVVLVVGGCCRFVFYLVEFVFSGDL